MKHSFSVSELQTVCSVHVANDPSQVVSVYYVRDSGVVSVEERAHMRAACLLQTRALSSIIQVYKSNYL